MGAERMVIVRFWLRLRFGFWDRRWRRSLRFDRRLG